MNKETNMIFAIAVKSGLSILNADIKRSKVVQLLLSWNSRRKKGMKIILFIAMERREILTKGNL